MVSPTEYSTDLPPVVFHEKEVESDGFLVKFLEAGQGSSVVILDTATWSISKLHSSLAQKYHVIAIELPGFGSSPENTGSRSAQDIAGTITQALAKIAPEKYTLIGTSFGANVALWQTLQAPNSIEALILISPTCLMPTGGMIDATPADMAERLFAHPEDATCLPTYDADMVAKELFLAQRLGSENHDTEAEQRLIEIRCATLVVFGSRDKLVSSEAASIYRVKIPNCNVSIVYDAGHAILAERPEALISTVVDYVERRETFVVGNQSSVINP